MRVNFCYMMSGLMLGIAILQTAIGNYGWALGDLFFFSLFLSMAIAHRRDQL